MFPAPTVRSSLACGVPMTIAPEQLIAWLSALDAELLGPAPSSDAGCRLDALIDQGVTLLAAAALADPSPVDAQMIDRVQRRLRAVADDVAADLARVRQARREVARVARAAVAS